MKKRIVMVVLTVLLLACLIPFGTTATEVNLSNNKCGDNAYWSYYEATGTLVISGTGPMDDYSHYTDVPWYDHAEEIKSIQVVDGVTRIGNYAFSSNKYNYGGHENLESVMITDTVVSIGDHAFANCSNINSIILPENISSIGIGAFKGCSNLESIQLPSGLEVISYSLFQGCRNLKSVTIPESVTEIGGFAFGDCENLLEIDISANVNNIASYAFSHCFKLKSIYLPNGVTSIGFFAFEYCSSLVAIYIPRSVTRIDRAVFSACLNLKDIFYEGLEAEWKATGFPDKNTLSENVKIHFVSSDFNVDFDDQFDFGFDNFSFVNNYPDFFTSDEQKQGDWNKLIDKISKVLQLKDQKKNSDFCYQISDEAFQRLASGMSNTVVEKLSESRSKFWSGSCYGMTAVAAIRYIDKNRLPISQIDESLANDAVTYDIKAPVNSANAENLINYYQLMQFLPLKTALEERNQKHIQENYSKTVAQITEAVQAGFPVLVCIANEDYSGKHAVLLLEVIGENEEYYTFSVYEPGDNSPRPMIMYKTPGEESNSIRIGYLGYTKLYSFQTSIYELDMRNYFGYDDNATFADYDRAVLFSNSDTNLQLSGGNLKLTYQDGQVVDIQNISGPFYICSDTTDNTASQEVYFTFDYTNVPIENILCGVTSASDNPCELNLILQDWSLSVASEQDISVSINSVKKNAEIKADSKGFMSVLTTQDYTGEDWPWYSVAADMSEASYITIENPEDGVQIESDGLKNAEIAVKNNEEVIFKELASNKTQVILTENDGDIEIADSEKQDNSISSTTRVAGVNRFDTAFVVADQMKANLGIDKFDAMVVASGTNFADALSGSYLAAVKNAPILLGFTTDAINNDVKDYIRENLNEGGTVYILGGESAVPASMETGLDGFTVKRLAGGNRFETNLLVLEEAGVGDKPILVCTGLSFADSLSASAAKLPILLVWNDLTDGQKALLDNLDGNKLYIIGGESAVGKGMEEQLKAYGNVERVAGGNRFETSVAIAEKFFNTPKSAVLAYAGNFPDGLCGGPLAAAMDAPLILTMDKFEAKAAEYIRTRDVKNGIILGGEGLISQETVNNIFQ